MVDLHVRVGSISINITIIIKIIIIIIIMSGIKIIKDYYYNYVMINCLSYPVRYIIIIIIIHECRHNNYYYNNYNYKL